MEIFFGYPVIQPYGQASYHLKMYFKSNIKVKRSQIAYPPESLLAWECSSGSLWWTFMGYLQSWLLWSKIRTWNKLSLLFVLEISIHFGSAVSAPYQLIFGIFENKIVTFESGVPKQKQTQFSVDSALKTESVRSSKTKVEEVSAFEKTHFQFDPRLPAWLPQDEGLTTSCWWATSVAESPPWLKKSVESPECPPNLRQAPPNNRACIFQRTPAFWFVTHLEPIPWRRNSSTTLGSRSRSITDRFPDWWLRSKPTSGLTTSSTIFVSSR